MARAALGWTGGDLAKAARVGLNTVSRFEQGGEARAASIEAIRRAFEAEGISFIGSDEVSSSGGAGVRLPL